MAKTIINHEYCELWGISELEVVYDLYHMSDEEWNAQYGEDAVLDFDVEVFDEYDYMTLIQTVGYGTAMPTNWEDPEDTQSCGFRTGSLYYCTHLADGE